MRNPAPLLLALTLPGLLLAGAALGHWVPPAFWWPALAWPEPSRLAEIVAADSLLPRIAMALLCGAALGLSGALAQLALRNPLASPGTLGVSAGAALALSAATLFAPGLLALLGRDTVAVAGGTAGIALVLLLTLRTGFDPATVALAGLAVGLYAGSIAAVLAVLHARQLAGLFVWNAGSLTQLGWASAHGMALVLLGGGAATALLARPLGLLELPDEMARGIGVPVGLVRLAALAVSVMLAAAVVGRVGVLGFVGLAAPALARMGGGGRRLLLWAPLLGAALLLLTDQAIQAVPLADGALLPTGAVSALAGAPLLLWLLPRLATHIGRPAPVRTARPAGRPLRVLGGLAGLALVVAAAALTIGRTETGWAWSGGLLAERGPRVVIAAAAGAVLGLAGTIFQRVLGNPMASPEVLGVGAGAMGGSAAALLLGAGGFAARLGAGAMGAAIVLGGLVWLARGRGFSTQIVLAGVALSACAESALALLLASGDPAAELVLVWSAGSTYGTSPAVAAASVAIAAALAAAAACLRRPLALLPLGRPTASALGLSIGPARGATLALATAATALGVVLAGPFSFVGLVAPHAAAFLGLHRAAAQIAAAGLAGAVVMVAADWLGRTVLFPSEVPAGLLAALLGGPVLLGALARARP